MNRRRLLALSEKNHSKNALQRGRPNGPKANQHIRGSGTNDNGCFALVFSKVEDRIATAVDDDVVRLWDLEYGTAINFLGGKRRPLQVAVFHRRCQSGCCWCQRQRVQALGLQSSPIRAATNYVLHVGPSTKIS